MGDFEVGYRYVQHVGPVETATIISRVCCHLQWLFVIDSGQQFIIWLYSGVVAFTSTDQREVPIEVVVGVIAGLVVITLVAVIFALLFIRWDLTNLSVDVSCIPTCLHTGSNGIERVVTRSVSLRERIHQHHVIHLTGKGVEKELRIFK